MMDTRRPLHELPPMVGTLERAIIDLIAESGNAGMMLEELPFALGVSPATVEIAIHNLRTGMYASECDDERGYDA